MKREDFYDLAAELEKDCGDWENAEGLSEGAKNALFAKVAQLDVKESKEEIKTIKYRPIKKRYLWVLAAALVLAMGVGVVGDRVWVSEKEELERASEISTKVNNEDKESILAEEEKIYQEIAETLGIAALRLGYYPNGMVLDSYSIAENTGWAYVNYLYEDEIVSIQMTKNYKEVSGSIQWDGEHEKIQNIKNVYGYEIDAYCVDEEHQNYVAQILYGNGYYEIYGHFSEKNEFFCILEQLFFKNL